MQNLRPSNIKVIFQRPSCGSPIAVASGFIAGTGRVCELEAGAVRYVHGGDEAPADRFAVSAWLRSRSDRRSAPTSVYVDVVGVNDQRPVVIVNDRMHVWTGTNSRPFHSTHSLSLSTTVHFAVFSTLTYIRLTALCPGLPG